MPTALLRALSATAIVGLAAWLTHHAQGFARLCAGRGALPAEMILVTAAIGFVLRARRARREGITEGDALHGATLPLGLALFMVPLADAWGSVRTHGSLIGGVLPYSDAADYLVGALGLLRDGTLDAWNSRRPLNSVLLALRLALVGGDLRAALIVQSVLLGASSWLAARAAARDLGWPAGCVIFSGILLFGGIFVPTSLSESLGLSLGALALATLWHAARDGAPSHLAIGFFTLSAALNARSGPFFVLPTLLAWASLGLHDRAATGRRWSPLHLAASLSGITAGFAFTSLILRVHHGARGAGHSNFSYTLYGLAMGGRGWEQALRDRPGLRAMGDAEAASWVYARAIERLRARPTDLAIGLYRNVESMVQQWTTSLSGDLLAGHPCLQGLTVLSLALLGGVTLRRLFRTHGADPVLGMGVAGCAGVLLSVPVIYMDGGERVFAATVPLVLCALAFTLSSLTGSVPSDARDRSLHSRLGRVPRVVAALLFTLCLTGVPLARAILPRAPEARATACPEGLGQSLWALRVPAEFILVSDPRAHRAPRIDLGVFRRGIARDPNLASNGLAGALATIPLGSAVLLGYDLRSRTLQYYAGPPELMARKRDTLDLCATALTNDSRTVMRVGPAW